MRSPWQAHVALGALLAIPVVGPTVDNEADSNFAYLRARGVSGTFSVTNRLRVAN